MKKMIFLINVVSAFIIASFCMVNAADIPPSNGKPLSTIIKSVEDKTKATITEAEFDDGYWEVEINKNNVCRKLYLDPTTGNELRRKYIRCDDDLPPAGSLPLSTIIRYVEDHEKGIIVEVEFDDGLWEFKLIQNGRKFKMYMNPQSLTSDR